MIKYTFRDDGPVPIKNLAQIDAQAVGEALAVLVEAAGGELTPLAVVDAARDAASPLHAAFEWDDAKAAEAYRLDQARVLVRVVRVTEEGEDEPTRAFLSVSEGGHVSYRTSRAVAQSLDLQLAVMRQAERDLAAWERRYHSLTDVCDLVTVAREKAQQRRAEMEARAH